MNTIYLALGSNVGNKQKNIQQALFLLKEKIQDITIAKLYETKPMYYKDQDIFLNTALRGKTEIQPQELLSFVKEIEKKVGRQQRFRNGPREIDIDILFYDNLIFQSKALIIPHPRLQERIFVLQPFLDLDPYFIHPVFTKTMQELYNEL